MGQILKVLNNLTENFVSEQCCNCGVWFAITQYIYNRRRDDKALFYCPNGHPQHYVGEREVDKLEKELAMRNRNLDESLAREALLKKEIKKNQGAGR